ncbi:GreA/GreB family elongation factor [Flavihumibacter sp. R14]|nr:GreA/GreB family elongation factor [Flavihumibacter soli]
MKNTTLIITQNNLDMIRQHIESSENLSVFNKTQLSADLQNAVKVTADELPADVVTTNSFVKLLDLESMQEFNFYLVMPDFADIKSKKVSCLSPIGMALFGYRTGAEIKWETPAGLRAYRLLSVTRAEKEPSTLLSIP